MDIQRTRRRVLKILNRCYADIPDPNSFVTRDEFIERSTAKWTVNEIKAAVMNSEEDPLSVVFIFVDKMEKYALKSRTHKQRRTFSIAYDIAVWVEDIVIAELHRNFKER